MISNSVKDGVITYISGKRSSKWSNPGVLQ